MNVWFYFDCDLRYPRLFTSTRGLWFGCSYLWRVSIYKGRDRGENPYQVLIFYFQCLATLKYQRLIVLNHIGQWIKSLLVHTVMRLLGLSLTDGSPNPVIFSWARLVCTGEGGVKNIFTYIFGEDWVGFFFFLFCFWSLTKYFIFHLPDLRKAWSIHSCLDLEAQLLDPASRVFFCLHVPDQLEKTSWFLWLGSFFSPFFFEL